MIYNVMGQCGFITREVRHHILLGCGHYTCTNLWSLVQCQVNVPTLIWILSQKQLKSYSHYLYVHGR